jgi:membrane protease YdiL (CAAX protease family)
MNETVGTGRLVAWLVLVGALASLNYTARAAGGDPPEGVLYEYETAIAGLIQFALILAVVLLICRGASTRSLLALRRPNSWKRAGLLSLGIFVGMLVLAGILDQFLDAGEEQGLTPEEWEPDRAWAFAANAAVVAGVAPIVEELTYRGLGFTLLARFGQTMAIILVGVLFGLGHGLVVALPVLIAFGIGLALLRSRTESVYPSIVLHAIFNSFALASAVAV